MANPNKDARLKWQGEITFEGTVEEFNGFREMLQKLPVRVAVPDLEIQGKLPQFHVAGYIRPPIDMVIRPDRLKKITEGAQAFAFKPIGGIAGGIRTPHIHVGDTVLLVDKEQFKAVMGEVARAIAHDNIDLETEYVGMVRSVIR